MVYDVAGAGTNVARQLIAHVSTTYSQMSLPRQACKRGEGEVGGGEISMSEYRSVADMHMLVKPRP